jgi:hypothetical protein
MCCAPATRIELQTMQTMELKSHTFLNPALVKSEWLASSSANFLSGSKANIGSNGSRDDYKVKDSEGGDGTVFQKYAS